MDCSDGGGHSSLRLFRWGLTIDQPGASPACRHVAWKRRDWGWGVGALSGAILVVIIAPGGPVVLGAAHTRREPLAGRGLVYTHASYYFISLVHLK